MLPPWSHPSPPGTIGASGQGRKLAVVRKGCAKASRRWSFGEVPERRIRAMGPPKEQAVCCWTGHGGDEAEAEEEVCWCLWVTLAVVLGWLGESMWER